MSYEVLLSNVFASPFAFSGHFLGSGLAVRVSVKIS